MITSKFMMKTKHLMKKHRVYDIRYSTLIKVTSSDSSDIPGFVVEELIQISFENEVLGKDDF